MSNLDRKIVITGIGIIAPNGIGKEAFWEAIKNGKSGIKKITKFNTYNFPTQIGGEIGDFNPITYMPREKIRRIDRSSQFAIAAAKMAIEDSNLNLEKENTEKIGVIVGTSIGGEGWIYNQHIKFLKYDYSKVNPFTSTAVYPNACSTEISLAFKIKGLSETISIGCSSGLTAIAHASEMIKKGIIDKAIVGGTETPLVPAIFAALCAGRNLSKRNASPTKASRPFEKNRDGLVVSEGAGMFILEGLDDALNRNAPIYGEILGWGETCDAYHIVDPELQGIQAARAIRMALDYSKCEDSKIDYICAFGISTPKSDIAETNAIKNVFERRAYDIPISSVKSMTGQPFGASGCFQLASGILALKKNILSPTINYEEPDPLCDLDYVHNRFREKKVEHILVETFGFGGKNTALIVKRYNK